MKNLWTLASLILTFTLFSCSNSDSESYDKSLAPVNSTKTVTPVTLADTLLSESTGTNAGVSASQTSVTAGTNLPNNIQPVGNVSAGKSGLNPAHGEPGHRCDISVGAPLSSPVQASAPVPTTPQVATSSPVVSQPVAQKPITGNSGKPNPPHGQPGHDCAVQVGAPLKN